MAAEFFPTTSSYLIERPILRTDLDKVTLFIRYIITPDFDFHTVLSQMSVQCIVLFFSFFFFCLSKYSIFRLSP